MEDDEMKLSWWLLPISNVGWFITYVRLKRQVLYKNLIIEVLRHSMNRDWGKTR